MPAWRGRTPPPAARHVLGLKQDFPDAHEFGAYARVFHQDAFNVAGSKAGCTPLVRNKPGITLARYQETKIRHFHALWDEYMAPDQVEHKRVRG